MPEQEGLRLVLTPPQLAAIMSGANIEPPNAANRAWGVAKAVVGVVEVIGGGALLAVPEPTIVTKVGGVALGAHGLDTIQAGARQAWNGVDTDTGTSDATTALARALGVDERTAERIGDGVDILVPLTVTGALAAVRVASIRAGRISLAAHEAAAGTRTGGHTIARHVGQTEAQLRARLAQQTRVTAASSFRTLAEAERAVAGALRAQKAVIANWANTARAGQTFAVTWPAGQVVGHGVIRSSGQLVAMRSVRVVLKKEVYRGKLYYVLTSFPVP